MGFYLYMSRHFVSSPIYKEIGLGAKDKLIELKAQSLDEARVEVAEIFSTYGHNVDARSAAILQLAEDLTQPFKAMVQTKKDAQKAKVESRRVELLTRKNNGTVPSKNKPPK